MWSSGSCHAWQKATLFYWYYLVFARTATFHFLYTTHTHTHSCMIIYSNLAREWIWTVNTEAPYIWMHKWRRQRMLGVCSIKVETVSNKFVCKRRNNSFIDTSERINLTRNGNNYKSVCDGSVKWNGRHVKSRCEPNDNNWMTSNTEQQTYDEWIVMSVNIVNMLNRLTFGHLDTCSMFIGQLVDCASKELGSNHLRAILFNVHMK